MDYVSTSFHMANWPVTHSVIDGLTTAWNDAILWLLAVFVLYLIHVRYNSPLRNVPGPLLASLTRLWKVKTILTARQELVLLELHRKHGIVQKARENTI